ncbi:MAG: MFS transporter [Mailhella sp.]|nr:MFS transporter [Mailhella sp.]
MPARNDRSMVYFLMLLNAFGILGLSIIMPALPIMADHYGLSDDAVWPITSSFSVPGILSVPFAGVLSDRYGRRAILAPCVALLVIGSLGCALAPTFGAFIAFRIVQGLGSGPLTSIAASIVTDSYIPSDRPRVMGLTVVSIAVSAAILPFIGGLLARFSWRLIFIIPTFAAAFIPWMFRLDMKGSDPSIRLAPYVKACRSFLSQKAAWNILMMDFLMAACMFGPISTYLPIIETNLFSATPAEIGTISMISSAGGILGGAAGGWLGSRRSLRGLMLFSGLFGALSFAVMCLTPTLWFFLLPLAMFNFGQNLTAPLIKTRIGVLSTPQTVGAAMAINGTIFRISQALAPAVCGLMWLLFGTWGPAMLGIACCFIVSALALFERKGVKAAEA